jgi:succinate dehydrogenase subunit C
MSAPAYRPYHPKWYRARMSVWWWLQNRAYATFVLRELTSLFVAYFAALLLWQVRAVSHGPAAYARFLARMGTPVFFVFNAVALAFVLFHSITWFNLAPTALVVRLRGKRVPDLVIVGLNYLAWAALSAAVAFILLRA